MKLDAYIDFKWRAGNLSGKKDKISVLGYIDARDVMDLLDKEVGSENRQSEYYEVKGNLFCRLGIKINNEWAWKSDCGDESNVEKKKGEASDALKRAAVQWGIGRFLYTLPSIWMPAIPFGKGHVPADSNGKRVRDVTKYVKDNYKTQLNERHAKQFPKEDIKKDNNTKTEDLFPDIKG